MIVRKATLAIAITMIVASFLAASSATAGKYEAMKDVDSARTVFDFRISDPDVALKHFELIHQMVDDPALQTRSGAPEIAVVFIGPSVKLVSTGETGISAESKKALSEKITTMDEDGVRLVICMVAADLHDVSSESVLPEIDQVENGWITLTGYQQQGYAMIADF